MNKNVYLTQEQKNDRKARLEQLKNVELPKVGKEIAVAKSQGDLSENAEYDAAKEKQALLNKERIELEHLLSNAILIKRNTSNHKVEIGHSISIEWQDGKKETVTLLGYGDGKVNISIDSPLGIALLDKKVNDTVNVNAPIRKLSVKILSIT